MITSLRARQIIDDRFQDFTIEEDIEDSDQLEELLEDVDYNVEKPISVATSEFMNNELDWRTPEENQIYNLLELYRDLYDESIHLTVDNKSQFDFISHEVTNRFFLGKKTNFSKVILI